MLSKIVLKNFRSFKESTAIDFRATNYQLLRNTNVSDSGILKATLLVGPNASGKSNIILSMKLLLDLLFREKEVDEGVFLCLFSEEWEYYLEYHFLINNENVRYSIGYNVPKKILCEDLYVGDELVLGRMGLSAKFYGGDEVITYGKEEVNETSLFLRTLFFNTRFAGHQVLRDWFEYLQNSVYFNAFERKLITYGKHMDRLDDYLEKFGPERINEFFRVWGFEQEVRLLSEAPSKRAVISTGSPDIKSPFFKRAGFDAFVPFHEESLGNQTLLVMLPPFMRVAESGGLLLVDEYSSGFHNELEELLVRHFMKVSSNSQMLVVSHSTNLLSTTLLRPDQIYAVEFFQGKGSSVKRFSDEGPRAAQNLEKMYLSGVFGGLPGYSDED